MPAVRPLLFLFLGCCCLTSACNAPVARISTSHLDAKWPPERPPPLHPCISLLVEKHTSGPADDLRFTAIEESTLKAYRESGLFDCVLPGDVDADIRAKITLNSFATFTAPLPSLSSYLLCVVACRFKLEHRLHTVLQWSLNIPAPFEGISEEETQTLWYSPSVLLLPTTIATVYGKVSGRFKTYSLYFSYQLLYDTVYDLNRLTILEATKRGFWQRLSVHRVKEEEAKPERETGSRIEGNQK